MKDVNDISRVHERLEANLSARGVGPTGLVHGTVAAADNVGGRVDGVAKAVDDLAVEFRLTRCEDIEADDFCWSYYLISLIMMILGRAVPVLVNAGSPLTNTNILPALLLHPESSSLGAKQK